MYIHVHTCASMHIHAHSCPYMHIHVTLYIYVHICIYIHTDMFKDRCVYIYVLKCACMKLDVDTYIYGHICYIFIYTCTYLLPFLPKLLPALPGIALPAPPALLWLLCHPSSCSAPQSAAVQQCTNGTLLLWPVLPDHQEACQACFL